MSKLNAYFIDFLRNINLTDNQIGYCSEGHKTLRKRLKEEEQLKDIVVDTFIQGSYRRSTINKSEPEKNPDVDIIIVTSLVEETNPPKKALEKFQPFLEKHYSGKYKLQGRSWGIHLSNVDLDFVVTSAPVEAEEMLKALYKSDETISNKTFINQFHSVINEIFKNEWKEEPLRIPDRKTNVWEDTHPIAQIHWTLRKNQKCNSNYLRVVRALKWWKQNNKEFKYPKGYPLEHIIGYCCPDGIDSVSEGIVKTLKNIIINFEENRRNGTVPVLIDHGTGNVNVLRRIEPTEFAIFYDNIETISRIAQDAFEEENVRKSATLWRQIFGKEFPLPPEERNENRDFHNKGTLYTPKSKSGEPIGGRYAR